MRRETLLLTELMLLVDAFFDKEMRDDDELLGEGWCMEVVGRIGGRLMLVEENLDRVVGYLVGGL